MKKNILIIFLIFIFALNTFGELPTLRRGDNQTKIFITKQLNLLGLKVGKVSMIPNDLNTFNVIINGHFQKINALKLNKPFRSFQLKVIVKRVIPKAKGIIIVDSKNATGPVIVNNKNATGPVIVNKKNATGPVIVNNKNTILLINKNQLLEANFIIDDKNMPAGIIINN